MTRKLELELTVSGATIKVFSDPSVPPDEVRFDASPRVRSGTSRTVEVGRFLKDLAFELDGMTESERISCIAFLRERYRDDGRRR